LDDLPRRYVKSKKSLVKAVDDLSVEIKVYSHGRVDRVVTYLLKHSMWKIEESGAHTRLTLEESELSALMLDIEEHFRVS
jgi:hypothetical protein